jgi:hypothetical protein
MENGPFDSCGLMRFPFLFDFKNPPAHQRAHRSTGNHRIGYYTRDKAINQAGGSLLHLSRPAGRHQAGMGGAGFSFNGWRAGLLQTLGMIAALGWPLRQAFCAPTPGEDVGFRSMAGWWAPMSMPATAGALITGVAIRRLAAIPGQACGS